MDMRTNLAESVLPREGCEWYLLIEHCSCMLSFYSHKLVPISAYHRIENGPTFVTMESIDLLKSHRNDDRRHALSRSSILGIPGERRPQQRKRAWFLGIDTSSSNSTQGCRPDVIRSSRTTFVKLVAICSYHTCIIGDIIP